jgi:adenylosuccinate synthase
VTLQAVVGGQYGSEGKGAIAAYLCSLHTNGLAIRVAGPNAGHTVIGRCPPDCTNSAATELPDPGPDFHASDRHPWRLRQVPVAAVSNTSSMLAIAAGSEVDPQVLLAEVAALDAAGYNAGERLTVDWTATVIEDGHKQAEAGRNLSDRIGSTAKGIGAARASRAMREATLAGDCRLLDRFTRFGGSVARDAMGHLGDGGQVLVEGTQGYLLGTHAGYYPQCTSSDCTAMDMLAMAGIAPWSAGGFRFEAWVVFRTLPIRVAGNSGPLLHETTWEALGLPEEHTTVTRKVRRVGQWDGRLARAAMEANGHGHGPGSPVHAALTMADYVIPELSGLWFEKDIPDHKMHAWDRLLASRSADIGRPVELVGTSPSTIINLQNSLARS